jgi:hypothetical protein
MIQYQYRLFPELEPVDPEAGIEKLDDDEL